MFKQGKGKAFEMSHSTQISSKLGNQAIDNSMLFQSVITPQFRSSNRATFASLSDKVKKNIVARKFNSLNHSEISVFQGNGFDSLLKSVKSSINNQFTSDSIIDGIRSCDNPFTVIPPKSFPKLIRHDSPDLVKPKAKKPKLHVMMRTNRKKKRKPQNKPEKKIAVLKSETPDLSDSFVSKSGDDKLAKSVQNKADTLGSSISEEAFPIVSSLVQPSKILTLSRLNVFNSGGASVNGLPLQSGPFIEADQSSWSEKGARSSIASYIKKSKHKHIIDSVLAANLDSLVVELNGMSICENPADNYVRVRPGEMPLPSIFRVIKIDVNRKMKDRILIPDTYSVDKLKLLKTRKDTSSQYESSLTVKCANRGIRKKSCSDQSADQQEQLPVSDSSDQCLPPKKRHRLVNIEVSPSVSPQQSSQDESTVFKKDMKSLTVNRKEELPRKAPGTDENKQGSGRLAQLSFGQQLTLDTSRESSACTPLLPTSPSRLSTRSSTLSSLFSPTASSIFRNRLHSRGNFAVACDTHATASSSLYDRLSCADCRLREQSQSQGRSTLRSLSVQVSYSNCSSDHHISSSEPSPLIKPTSEILRSQGRSAHKRRISTNLSVHDSDSSPPRLDRTTSVPADAYQNSNIYSDPQEILCSSFRNCKSPRRQSSNKVGLEVNGSPNRPCSPQEKMFSGLPPQGTFKPFVSESATLTTRKLCNTRSISPQISNRSISEYEPLPLEYCSNRKLVKEIQAATASDSDDDNSNMDEPNNNSNPRHHSVSALPCKQPHEKLYHTVGLFSDFYKHEKPRKICENVLRCRDKLAHVREEHKFGVMPQPLHIGQFYMRQVQDFQLPYDIWWQCIHQQLKKSEWITKLPTIGTKDAALNDHKPEVHLCNCSPQQSDGRDLRDNCRNRDGDCSQRMDVLATQDNEPGKELTCQCSNDPSRQKTCQDCSCVCSNCRHILSVKTQSSSSSTCKLPERTVDDCKDKRKTKLMNKKMKDKLPESAVVQPSVKPMTFRERCYARKHRTFLVRNVDKVRNQRSTVEDLTFAVKEEMSSLCSNTINALSSDPLLTNVNGRSVKTRLAAYAKNNPELVKRHQLAQVFDKMLTELMSLKDEDDYNLVGPLMSLPSIKKEPQYYQVVREPIDLSIIKQRVKMGFYDHLSFFNSDMMLLFANVELYCSSKSDIGQVILKLRQVFISLKSDMACQIDELLGPNTTRQFMDSTLENLDTVSSIDMQEEDVIKCICGVTRDEGLMLQCDKCMIWQHCDCVQASGKEDHYLCDRCEPRYYDPEILLIPQPEDAQPDCIHYLTFVKDDVQYAVGDCVYVMRDCKRTNSGTPLHSSHSLNASLNPDRLDVFRLHQLWKNSKGDKFASGTPYLRPQETFHEPTRKFYRNELFRTPNFEIISMKLVAGKCIVMDPGTYVKGRPKGVKEQDVYICEYRVDKTAHLFHKISKIWYPINTSRFCFDRLATKLSIKRTYLPHKVPDEYKRKAERNVTEDTPSRLKVLQRKEKLGLKTVSSLAGLVKVDEFIKNDVKLNAEVKVNVNKELVHKIYNGGFQEKSRIDIPLIYDSKRKDKKQKLDKILIKLLSNLPGKHKVDLSYLLDEAKRIRKKITK